MASDWNFSILATKKQLIYNTVAVFGIFLSGIFMAISYYVLAAIEAALQSVDCLIINNFYFDTCQEWFALSIYPALNLRYILLFASYFYIFGIVIGLFYIGFKTKKHPSLFVVHMILSIIFGYLAIEISNIYRALLANPLMYEILTPFAIYNKIMIYFPQFIFFVVFCSGLIGLMGIMKGKFNEGVEEY